MANNRLAEIETRASTQGATNFSDGFYDAINKHIQLSPYYVSSSPAYRAAGVLADVVINGRRLEDSATTTTTTAADKDRPTSAAAAQYEALLLEQRHGGARVRYEVDGVDSQVLNARYAVGCPADLPPAAPTTEPRLSLMVQVSGTVVFEEKAPATGRKMAFSETFVLVPNWESYGRGGGGGGRRERRYLILSQNFRALGGEGEA